MKTINYTNGSKKYILESDKEYQEFKKRTEKGAKLLEGKWSDPDPKVKRWIYEFELMAQAMLDWEIDHDLLPI